MRRMGDHGAGWGGRWGDIYGRGLENTTNSGNELWSKAQLRETWKE